MIYTGTYKTKQRRVFLATQILIQAPELAYVDVIAVCVEGKAYDIIKTGPATTERQTLYRNSAGSLQFDDDLGVNKNVFVIYQR